MFNRVESLFRSNRVFVFLIIYRWASLLPALFTFGVGDAFLTALPTLILALAANTIISIYNHKLNKAVLERPAFLGIDILFSAILLAMSGGAGSPYYLYALSPLLAGAFFFQVRGALLASFFFTPLYILIQVYLQKAATDAATFTLQITGIWLLPLLFAYPSTLLKSVNKANEDLANAHRQLEIIH